MTTIYKFSDILWTIEEYYHGNIEPIGLCPRCRCRLSKSKEEYSRGEYKYQCIQCDFKITLNKALHEKGADFLNVLESEKYKDAEIINLDGDLVRVGRNSIKDNDYWIDAKISKNARGQIQLMVLAGSKNETNKTQLFLDPLHEKMTFDQNDSHPREIFSKVIAIFKDSTSTIGESDG